MPTQLQRRESTTRALISAARAAFTENGFDDTSIDEIAARAGATKGAVYHYFSTKEDLFRGALESVEGEILDRVIHKAVESSDPAVRLILGNDAFLESALDPELSRIALIEGPAVLG